MGTLSTTFLKFNLDTAVEAKLEPLLLGWRKARSRSYDFPTVQVSVKMLSHIHRPFMTLRLSGSGVKCPIPIQAAAGRRFAPHTTNTGVMTTLHTTPRPPPQWTSRFQVRNDPLFL